MQEDLTLFVTVGSTSFDGLIEIATSAPFLRGLYRNNFRTVVVQYGRGKVPTTTFDDAVDIPRIRIFAFAPSLTSDMQLADIILSHGGSGTIFEAIDMCKRIVVVPNRSLMDDHQMELAEELQLRGIVTVADASQPEDVLRKVVEATTRPPPTENPLPRNTSILASIIAEELS